MFKHIEKCISELQRVHPDSSGIRNQKQHVISNPRDRFRANQQPPHIMGPMSHRVLGGVLQLAAARGRRRVAGRLARRWALGAHTVKKNPALRVRALHSVTLAQWDLSTMWPQHSVTLAQCER